MQPSAYIRTVRRKRALAYLGQLVATCAAAALLGLILSTVYGARL